MAAAANALSAPADLEGGADTRSTLVGDASPYA